MTLPFIAFVAVLQQGISSATGFTTPPGGDTLGYWQQRVEYTITATLDEPAQRVRAAGTLKYVNNSPDTLRYMYMHQYLNAFRPGSRWSADDEREARDRFQQLTEPDYAYERFTAPVRVNGSPVSVSYPNTPDSTVVYFKLPAPLAPRDSAVLSFEWDARPSTLPRRQGRRGRHWDLAQWYPKVAVYDRGGWQPNALRPAGEFYGEFGTYDVTLVVANDQVVGATGVPVSGDPGWGGAIRNGFARAASQAYSAVPANTVSVPAGYKAVRFFARDVHHFAWSASPDYRYEGGAYVRAVPGVHWPTWDTVSVHVLYRAGDDTTWGGLRVVRRTIAALQWLESIYGPYAYPQMTVLHRIEGGGTEFPMMQMNGSPSQGLILHEGGHNFTYGILANNEWRSGWMDEGFTSYQTEWAQQFTPQERLRADIVNRPARGTGYRARAIRPTISRFDAIGLDQTMTDLHGDAEPIGTTAHDFRDFATYNDMIYTRAQVMYGQLRDVLGDSLFRAFLHDYYDRWALKHVDERAMRASAERVSGRDLGWFFDEWVHHTGVMDYALVRDSSARDTSGGWVTAASVRRVGEYRHRIAVGVRTARGWTVAQTANPSADAETVRIVTADAPLEVRLDPFHFSWDWDRRDDVAAGPFSIVGRGRLVNVDWPFLEQSDRDAPVMLLMPMAWYSQAGGLTLGARSRTSYLSNISQTEFGVAWPTARRPGAFGDVPAGTLLQAWWRLENPTLGSRPRLGWRLRAALLDGVAKADVGYHRERTAGAQVLSWGTTLTYANVVDAPFTPDLWSERQFVDLDFHIRSDQGFASDDHWIDEARFVVGADTAPYAKVEVSVGGTHPASDRTLLAARAYAGYEYNAPIQRLLYLSAADPVSTFENHWWRPADAILKQRDVNWVPLGGPALRGYSWSVASRFAVAGNFEASRLLSERSRSTGALGLRLHGFTDVATLETMYDVFADAGLGVSVRGRLYDRDVLVRLDAPFYLSQPIYGIDRRASSTGAPRSFAARWLLSFNDIW